MSHVCSSELFQKTLRIRMIEEEIARRYNEQKMRCPVHLCIGHEAIAVGVCHHLKLSDYVVSNHRAHAHYLAKGGSLKRMIAEIYGKKTGCAKGMGGSMHLVDLEVGFIGSTPIVGGTIPVGVGIAHATVMKDEERITTIFFGEGAAEEGVFSESLNFAALMHLPVLFVCENNFYSVYTPLHERQPPARTQAAVAKAHGVRAYSGNGSDLSEVARLAGQAIDSIRLGQGPALLELTAYRHLEHCGPNLDPSIPDSVYQEWIACDPLKGYVGERDAINKEIAEAFAFAESSPYPEVSHV